MVSNQNNWLKIGRLIFAGVTFMALLNTALYFGFVKKFQITPAGKVAQKQYATPKKAIKKRQ